jgi:endonuclease G, mitochondrial
MSDKREVTHIREYVDLVSRKHGGVEGLRDVIGRKLKQRSATTLESAADTSVTIKGATKALESFERHRAPSDSDLHQLEAIIDAEIRPVIDIVNGTYSSTLPLWTQLSTDAGVRGRIERCIESIGRIELPGHPRLPYGGTGFLVGDGLVMTNRHVAEIFTDGIGTRALVFNPGAKAGIDFVREYGQPAGPIFMVRRVVMIHPYWDMAILAVDGLGSRKALKLSLEDARDIQGHDIAVIGYPAFDPRNPSDVQQNLFNGRYGVKRLQPGELQGGMKTASFQKLVKAATHDCSRYRQRVGVALWRPIP